MKFSSLFSMFLILMALVACQKEEDMIPDMDPVSKDTAVVDDGGDNTGLTVLKAGTFTGQNNYPASGTAQIIRDKQQQHFVRLGEDFKTSFATGSVTMYLSKKANLDLKSPESLLKLKVINTNGKHDFPISESQSTDFQYVIIWCAPAGIQFGRAELK